MTDKIDVVIPARNAAGTIAEVVRPFADHPAIGDVIVVVNPPDAATSIALSEFGSNVVTIHTDAAGKGQAVMFGLEAVATEHVIFCDADLTGLRWHHVGLLISDAIMGVDSVCVGIPDIPDNYPVHIPKQLRAWPWVSGQRCLPRKLVRPLILHGYLMETQINHAAFHAHMPMRFEWLIGCHSPFHITEKRIKSMEEDLSWGKAHGILP